MDYQSVDRHGRGTSGFRVNKEDSKKRKKKDPGEVELAKSALKKPECLVRKQCRKQGRSCFFGHLQEKCSLMVQGHLLVTSSDQIIKSRSISGMT